MIGRLDELHAGAIQDDPLPQLADLAVHDPPFDDDGALAERQPEVVQRTELQRELRLDLSAPVAQIEDRHRLVDRDFSGHEPGNRNALGIALFAWHSFDYRTLTCFG